MKEFVRTIAVGILVVSGLRGDEPDSGAMMADATELGETVVVAAGHEVARMETPYAVHVLSQEEIRLRLQAPILMEALVGTPGVMLQKTGHGMTSPYLRGFTSQRTVLITDGIRLNNSFLREGPNQYWNQVDPFFFNELEVMMGPASSLYGSDAVGGTIYASSTPLTRGVAEGGLQWHGGVAVVRYAGAEDSYSGHVEAEGAVDDRWTMRLGLTGQDFGTLTTGGGLDNPHTRYEQWGGNLRLQYWLSDDERILFGYDHFDQDNIDRVHRTTAHQDFEGTLTKGKAGDLHRLYDHNRDTAFVRYELRNGAGFLEEIDAQVFYSRFSEFYVRHRSLARADYRPTDVDTLGARLRLQTPSDWGTWNYGVEVYHDRVDSDGREIRNGIYTEEPQGLVANDGGYLMIGAFLQNEVELSNRFTLTMGVRYDHVRMDADGVAFSDDYVGSLDGSWDAVTASVRGMYRMLEDDQLNVFAGASQGFRAPNLSDATREDDFGGGQESPTADLDAERFLTLEAGIKHRSRRTSLEVTAYHTFIEDRIGRMSDPEPTKRNLDNGYIQGIDCQGELWFSEWLGSFAWIAWQYGKEDFYNNRDVTMGTGDYPMSRMHPLTGEIGLRCQTRGRRLWAECAVRMAGGQDRYTLAEENDNRFPPGGTPSYTVVNLRGGAKLTETTDLAVAIENLCDEEYRIHGSGVNEPGRNLVVTVQQRF